MFQKKGKYSGKIKVTLPALLAVALLHAQPHQNDKIITLAGDTLSAFISADPYKETRVPGRIIRDVYDYGFTHIIAIFPNDSLRILYPNDILGYYRAEPGRNIGSGWFESRPLHAQWTGAGIFSKGSLQRFVHRIYSHKDFTVFMLRQADFGSPPDYFYYLYYPITTDPAVIITYKQWRQWAAANPPFDQIAAHLKKPKRKKYSFFSMLQDAGKEYKFRNP